jgi:hypothetical protein
LPYAPEEIRRCIVFLGYKDANNAERVMGSAFWILNTVHGHHPAYLVTAAHVLDDIKKHSDTILMRFDKRDGLPHWKGANFLRWQRHSDPDVDVAFLKIGMDPEWSHAGWPTVSFVTEDSQRRDRKRIELGDEVFFPGMFWPHRGSSRNIPIVRTGNIAGLREEKVDTQYGTMDVYLVEARSVGGLSGSPVIVDVHANKFVKERGAGPTPPEGAPRFRLVGLVNGHFIGTDTEGECDKIPLSEMDKLNMGIAFVTPSDKILEGLGVFMDEELKEAEEHRRRKYSHISFDSTPHSNIGMQTTPDGVEIPVPSKEQFIGDLKKASRKKD